jgi:pimeloyl-ACP methyl ester carboxylesterase
MHWPGELRRLAGHTVISLDLPGHGHSGGEGRQDIGAYAQDVVRFAEGLTASRFVLAGYSMGGAIALELSLHHQEMLAGLILVATGTRLPVANELLDALRDDYENAIRLMTGWSEGNCSDPKTTQFYLRRLRELQPGLLHQDYAACNVWDRAEDLGALKLPTLVVCGDADQLTPLQYSLDLQRRIEGAQLVIVPGAGHMLMIEQPALVASAVRDFLTGLAPS